MKGYYNVKHMTSEQFFILAFSTVMPFILVGLAVVNGIKGSTFFSALFGITSCVYAFMTPDVWKGVLEGMHNRRVYTQVYIEKPKKKWKKRKKQK